MQFISLILPQFYTFNFERFFLFAGPCGLWVGPLWLLLSLLLHLVSINLVAFHGIRMVPFHPTLLVLMLLQYG